MTALTPTAKMQFFKADGTPLVGGKLYTYTAGTTTPQPTYTDSSGGTANTNPVILDSRGEANIWLGGATYKFKLADSNDVEIWTVDNISAPTSGVSPALSGNVTIDTNSSGPALKITQTGTGYALRVQDSTDPDLTPFVIDNTGKLGLGTTSPAAALDIDNSGEIQFSESGLARTVISANATDSTIDVKDNRNFVVNTNAVARFTISGSGTATFAGAVTVSSGGVAITGNSSVTGTFSVSNSTSLTGNLSIVSGTTERQITLGSSGGYFYGNATQIGWYKAGGGNFSLDVSNGNFIATGSVTGTTSVITDTITERTASAGVTVGGVLLKNSLVAGSARPILSFTEQATTSGTEFLFNNIPSYVNRISVMLNGISLSGSDNLIIQLGTGTSGTPVWIASGYVSQSLQIGVTSISSTSAFNVILGNNTVTLSGLMTISKMTSSSWLSTSYGADTTPRGYIGYGILTGAGTITQIRLTRTGTNTFDAGSVNVFYE